MFVPYCWASMWVPGAGPCDGQLIKAHLLPKQVIRRELAAGVKERRFNGSLRSLKEVREALEDLVWDAAVWVPMCGGPTGIGGHHGQLDHSRTLRIPRDAIPSDLEAFAAEHGLSWWLDRTYGPREEAA